MCNIKTREQSQEDEVHDANVSLVEDVMSIREHLDAVEIPPGSNFISLLKQRIDAGDHVLRSHLEKGNRNSTYTSSCIQNEIIELIYEHSL